MDSRQTVYDLLEIPVHHKRHANYRQLVTWGELIENPFNRY